MSESKLKLLTRGYGFHSREYTRRALCAIGKEAAAGSVGEGEEEEEDRDYRQGVDLVYWADPGRLSILAKGL